jgi:RNA recognition motif-containing protein
MEDWANYADQPAAHEVEADANESAEKDESKKGEDVQAREQSSSSSASRYSRSARVSGTRAFLGNLSFEITEDDIYNFFTKVIKKF